MLENLHVKNFALIEETDVDFGEGLNILTGETGAGKSILIDAVTAALGGRVRGDMIRHGCDAAYVELTFSVPEEEKRQALKELEVDTEYDCITISRKILPRRSIHKINGETVTSAKLRMVTSLLMDIHGQHEHQSLMNPQKHLEVLDQYGGRELEIQRVCTEKAYTSYREAERMLAAFDMDPETRLRQMDFLQYEIGEIEEAGMRPGETEALEKQHRRMLNSQRISGSLMQLMQCLCGDVAGGCSARDLVSEASGELTKALRMDPDLEYLHGQLAEVEDLLDGFCRDMEEYQRNMAFDPELFAEMEARLDVLHRLESKYGSSYEEIMKTLEEKQLRLEELETYEKDKVVAEARVEKRLAEFLRECQSLSELRHKAAPRLQQELESSIRELNFNHVDFRISFGELAKPGRLGMDQVEFLISLNKGEEARPLGSVASGGELSRIMLAIKTVLADKDEIPTLIFDEIDTGISGRTAQKVSEKLALIGQHRQVICITHLPQIASMADHHYEIRKSVLDDHTITRIHLLDAEEEVEELARLLGGAELTEMVRQSAQEMKRLADAKKQEARTAA